MDLAPSRPSVGAAELVASGRCSAACLLAQEGGHGACRCRCEGLYHGALAEASVQVSSAELPHSDGDRPPWFARYCYYSQAYLDMVIPVVRTTAQFNIIWQKQKRTEELFSVATRQSRLSWTAKTDTWTARDDYRKDMLAVGGRLVEAVLAARSNRGACGEVGASRIGVSGLRTAHDAQVVACALSELWFFNPDGAIGLHLALAEDIGRESHRPASRAWLERERDLPAIEDLCGAARRWRRDA